jgi:hypothetical protein
MERQTLTSCVSARKYPALLSDIQKGKTHVVKDVDGTLLLRLSSRRSAPRRAICKRFGDQPCASKTVRAPRQPFPLIRLTRSGCWIRFRAG